MRDRLLRLALPAGMVALAAVVVVGLIAAPSRPVDRVEVLTQQLRCPVCQGESVADSPSETARRMQEQVAGMVAAGRSDQEIRDHYVARYGEWILLDPPARGDTLLLWLLPGAAAVVGIVVIATRRRPPHPHRSLDETERAALRRQLTDLREREGGV